jgi:hypothetical protein
MSIIPHIYLKLDPQIYKIYAKGGQRYGKKAGYRTEGRSLSPQPRPAFFSASKRFQTSKINAIIMLLMPDAIDAL